MPAYTCDRCGHAIDKAEGFGTYPKDGGTGFVCGLCIRDSVVLGLKPEKPETMLDGLVRILLRA